MEEKQNTVITEILRMKSGHSKTSGIYIANRTASYSLRLSLNIPKSRNVSVSCHVSHSVGPQFESRQVPVNVCYYVAASAASRVATSQRELVSY